MNQPPPHQRSSAAWRRPRGVSVETWDYVQQRTIADHYDAFVADTPLCRLDQQLLEHWLPADSLAAAGQVVLDLGAGTGRAAVPLASRGYQVIAIDLSQPMLVRLNERSEQLEGAGQVHPVRANLVDLHCIRDDSADHAICLFSTLGMIQGRQNRLEVLRHISRIIRPGGKLVVHVHNRWAALREKGGMIRLLRSWLNSLKQGDHEFGDAVYPYRGLAAMFLHRFSASELTGDLQSTGWSLQKLERISIDGASADSSAKVPGGFIALAECGRSRETKSAGC